MIEHFGIGYCSRGMFQGHIAIPIHNPAGGLIAYLGRMVDGKEPKYKLPRGFKKSQVL